MKITIHQPVGFNETGGRSNNEDSIHPSTEVVKTSDTLFLVCDGVGGLHKGEIASSLACQSISSYFTEFPETDFTQEYIRQALKRTVLAFEEMEKEDPDSAGMATTLTLLAMSNGGIAVAHLGDSRVYQVREGKIIYQTKDHKWVNELVASGVISEAEAMDHPKRNVITRVISAGRNDEADFKLITDVKPDDYFFMCTDGVLEQLYDELLEYHLGNHSEVPLSPEDIIAKIKEECEGKTNDNFSAYLIKIHTTEATNTVILSSGVSSVDTDDVIISNAVTANADITPVENDPIEITVPSPVGFEDEATVVAPLAGSQAASTPVISSEQKKQKWALYLAIFIVLILCCGTAFYFMSESKEKVVENIPAEPEVEEQPPVQNLVEVTSETEEQAKKETLTPTAKPDKKISGSGDKKDTKSNNGAADSKKTEAAEDATSDDNKTKPREDSSTEVKKEPALVKDPASVTSGSKGDSDGANADKNKPAKLRVPVPIKRVEEPKPIEL